MKTIDELWYGNISPFEQYTRGDKRLKELLPLVARNRDELGASLTDKQKETLEKFEDCMNEMHSITAPLIRELIDHIEVYETEGEGKYKTQRIVIFYRFVGHIEIPESAFTQPLTKDTRQGVAVSYIPKALPA